MCKQKGASANVQIVSRSVSSVMAGRHMRRTGPEGASYNVQAQMCKRKGASANVQMCKPFRSQRDGRSAHAPDRA